MTGTRAAATPKIEIGVSLYGTSAQAATRIQATTDDYTAHGATTRQLKVGSLPATDADATALASLALQRSAG